ncbi:early endosome antigen 1-like [Prorops nasuta]|uniref:early endosome antigen 1-like n=1 Tax=Prorops nasuta TaxID=863751 RepID=UPI0034CD038C
MDNYSTLELQLKIMIKAKTCLEAKYMNIKKLWQESDKELQELKLLKLRLKTSETQTRRVKVENKLCITDNSTSGTELIEDLKEQNQNLLKENEDIKNQLQKCRLDFDIFEKEFNLEKEQLQGKLDKHTKETENLIRELFIMKDSKEKLIMKISELEEKLEQSLEVNVLYKREYESEKLAIEDNKTEKNLFIELSESEQTTSVLQDRIISLKNLLNKESLKMVKLEANFNVLKNENTILKTEMGILENKATEEITQLKEQLKETHMDLSIIKDNYQRVKEDFERIQNELLKAVKREVSLQESFTNMEKNYCSKLMKAEIEGSKLEDLINKLNEELANLRKEHCFKISELRQTQIMCKSYSEELLNCQQDMNCTREKIAKLELMNCRLLKEMNEENGCKCILDLKRMHSAIMELKRECQSKSESKVCMNVELTEGTTSRSDIYNEFQYVVSYIHTWIEQRQQLVEKLNLRLKSLEKQIFKLEQEKKELRRINISPQKSFKKNRKAKRAMSSLSAECTFSSKLSPCSSYCHLFKKCSAGPIKSARRTTMRGDNWYFPKMEHIAKEILMNNEIWHTNFCPKSNSNIP